MPTPTGLLKSGDRFYHGDEPHIVYTVVSRSGNDDMYSILFRREDGKAFPFGGGPARRQHLMVGPIRWKFEHLDWKLIDEEQADLEHKLTCSWCKNAPADHLVVTDLKTAGRQMVLVCGECAYHPRWGFSRAPEAAITPSSVWLFQIRAVGAKS
jgi:hypothetical protein